MPRAKLRTQELRDHLLVVAVDVLTQEGVTGFTARNIAKQAETSTPALYELFGDRAGLLREVFVEGFRKLGDHLRTLRISKNPRTDLVALIKLYRAFLAENRTLAELMYSRPFADFRPGPAEIEAGAQARKVIIEQVRRCVDAEILHGSPTDIALLLDAMVHGLSEAESAGRLGKSKALIDRRWNLATETLLAGLS